MGKIQFFFFPYIYYGNVLSLIFQVTLTSTEYEALYYSSGTMTHFSINLASLLNLSTLNVHIKCLAGISYDATCTKLGMYDLYTVT
ncbi:unnamed protein product [Spirodela intermedia]|uniref:Uncharacterized protein n=1 Tax=Spirodela intermedia TaxID=51605 RepID=A0A7I8LB72_SPIIN|nr:unnamed protein product [Spirodela intermedia]